MVSFGRGSPGGMVGVVGLLDAPNSSRCNALIVGNGVLPKAGEAQSSAVSIKRQN